MTDHLSNYHFTERDEFHRKHIAEKIIKLLTNNIDLSPMIIDGDWGTGKSEFCHKLKNLFKEEHPQAQIIYIDAFKADHADNPLMTIIAEIMKLIPDDEQKTTFLEKALPVLRYSAGLMLKAGVNYVLKKNTDDIADGLDKYIQEAANKSIDASLAALLKDHEKAEQNLESLKTLMKELAADNPIIIFIDELDRCRPDFSVNMIEVIKHTFSVENVKFVLVTNSKQLQAAINHQYGATIDAKRYLDKFIKFTIQLPELVLNNAYEKQYTSIKYFDYLANKSEILAATSVVNNREEDAVYYLIRQMLIANKLSLREVETFIRYLEIAASLGIGMTVGRQLGLIQLNVIAIFIDCFIPELKIDIYNQNTKAKDFLNLIGIKNINTENQISIENGIIYLLAQDAKSTNNNINEYIEEYNNAHNFNLKKVLFERDFYMNTLFDKITKTIDILNFR